MQGELQRARHERSSHVEAVMVARGTDSAVPSWRTPSVKSKTRLVDGARRQPVWKILRPQAVQCDLRSPT